MKISTTCWNCEKASIFYRAFIFLWNFWICYYPWSLDLRKCSRNRLKEQYNEDGDIQVSFSYFLIYFPDILITFETYCLLKASMNFLTGQDKCAKALDSGCNFIVYYFTYLPFFSVLFELRYAPCRYLIPAPDLLTIQSDQFSLLSYLNISFYSIYMQFVYFLCVLTHTPSNCTIIFHIYNLLNCL